MATKLQDARKSKEQKKLNRHSFTAGTRTPEKISLKTKLVAAKPHWALEMALVFSIGPPRSLGRWRAVVTNYWHCWLEYQLFITFTLEHHFFRGPLFFLSTQQINLNENSKESSGQSRANKRNR